MSNKTAKTVILVYALILIVLSLLPIEAESVGLSAGSEWYSHLTYQHFHASIFHVLCNAWAMLTIVFFARSPLSYLFTAFIISCTYPFAGSQTIIGASGFVYALAGLHAFNPSTKKQIVRYNLFFLLTIPLGILFSSVAVGIHAYCYFFGALCSLLNRPISPIRLLRPVINHKTEQQ